MILQKKRILKGPGWVIPLIFPKVSQSSRPESLGFRSLVTTPPLKNPIIQVLDATWSQELLVPGGRLCLTMFSPLANITGSNCPVAAFYRHQYAERECAGCKWPGEEMNMLKILEKLLGKNLNDLFFDKM